MFGDVRKAMRGETDREGHNIDKQFKKFLSLTLGGVSMDLAVFLMEAVITWHEEFYSLSAAVRWQGN